MDLTTAIIAMSKAAEKRRIARKDLIAATELVAAKIVEDGRAGDAVEVGGIRYRIESLHYPCSQWSNVQCTATDRENTLVRTICGGNGISTVLLDSRSGHHDGNNLHRPSGLFYRGEDEEIGWAAPEHRQQFAADAAEILSAFAVLYESQAKSMAESTVAISRLAIG